MVSNLKDDENVEKILSEYKMSMGGCFFSKAPEEALSKDSRQSFIESMIKTPLFNINELLLIYDKSSDEKKRELFRQAVLVLRDLKFNENKD